MKQFIFISILLNTIINKRYLSNIFYSLILALGIYMFSTTTFIMPEPIIKTVNAHNFALFSMYITTYIIYFLCEVGRAKINTGKL